MGPSAQGRRLKRMDGKCSWARSAVARVKFLLGAAGGLGGEASTAARAPLAVCKFENSWMPGIAGGPGSRVGPSVRPSDDRSNI